MDTRTSTNKQSITSDFKLLIYICKMIPIRQLNDNKGKPEVPYYQDKAKMDKVTQESDAFKKKWKHYNRGSGVPGKYGMPATLSFKEFVKEETMEELKLKPNEFYFIFDRCAVIATASEQAQKVAALYGTDKVEVIGQYCKLPVISKIKVKKPIVTAL